MRSSLIEKIRNIGRDEMPTYIIMATVFAMFFTTHLLSYGVIFALIASFFQTQFLNKFKCALKNRGFQLIVFFYLLHLIGLIYSENLDRGLFNIQIKLTLLVIPLIIFTGARSFLNHLKEILISFVAGAFLACILCLIISYLEAMNNGVFNPSIYGGFESWSFYKLLINGYTHFNYSFLSHFIHVSYFSMYLVLALYLVYFFLSSNWKEFLLIEKLLLLALMFFFLIMILILMSRAAIFCLFCIALFELVRSILKKGISIKIAIGFSLLFVTLFTLLLQSGRFKSIRDSFTVTNTESLKQSELRILIWESALGVIKKHPFIGVGTGDVQNEFEKGYSSNLKENTNGKYYDAHSEFLQTSMRLGIIGGITLLTLLILPLRIALVHKRSTTIQLIYFILIFINFGFESMLNRFNGVIFFTLLYCLLVIKTFPKDEFRLRSNKIG